MNKLELLEKVAQSRADFESLIAQFSDEQMLQPVLPGGWTVKDFLAHIAWWARRAHIVISAVINGLEPEYSLDESNKIATLVWEYIYDSSMYSGACGNHQYTANGNHVWILDSGMLLMLRGWLLSNPISLKYLKSGTPMAISVIVLSTIPLFPGS